MMHSSEIEDWRAGVGNIITVGLLGKQDGKKERKNVNPGQGNCNHNGPRADIKLSPVI